MTRLMQTALLFLALFSGLPAQAELAYGQLKKAYQNSYQHESTENYTEAIKALNLIYNHYPNSYTVNLRLGYLHLLHGQYANAKRHYQAAQQAIPGSISPRLGQMSVAIARLDFDEAEQLGFTILKQDPNNYYGNLKLAYALAQNKKYDNATSLVEKMLALYPEDVAFITQYAALFAAQKQYDKASEYYANVLLLDPENISAKNYFAPAR